MGMEICGSCGGTGGWPGSEMIDGQYVSVWRTCTQCNGGGTIYVEEYGGQVVDDQSSPRRSRDRRATPEESDQKFASFLVLVIAVAAFYFFFGGDWGAAFERVVSGPWDANFWVRVLAVVAVAVVTSRLLARHRGYVRYLRYAAAAAIVAAIIWFFYVATR